MRPLPFPQMEPEPASPADASVEAPKVQPKRTSRATGSGDRQVKRTAQPIEGKEPFPDVQAPESPKPEAAINISPAPASLQPSFDIVFRPPDPAQRTETPRNATDDFLAKPGRPEAGEMPLVPFSNSGTGEVPGRDGKLILLTRILSGLIDLLFVFLWTVAFIIAEDTFSGIEIFDPSSLFNGVLLLLANYFLYSLFFLGTSNQTIGMMITNLHVVGESGGRPEMRRIALRCLLFLPSLLLLGAGLVWAFVDRESRCLHDTASRTRVEPVGTVAEAG